MPNQLVRYIVFGIAVVAFVVCLPLLIMCVKAWLWAMSEAIAR